MFDWLDVLSSAAGAAIDEIVAFLQWLVAVLVYLFEFLYSILVAIFQFFYSLAQTVGKFFATLWNDWIKGILQDIWTVLQKVHAWVENLLSPIIDFLKKIQSYVNWLFVNYIKPFLTILNQIRGFLNVLASFGVQWAKELDSWLGKIEAQLIGYFQKVEGYLNAVIGILNSLADPLGLFRGPGFVMSMRRIFPSFCRGFSGMPLGYFFPNPGRNQPAGWGGPGTGYNPTNPTFNPPPSAYFDGDDGLGDFDGEDPGDPITDEDADMMQPLDYFDDDNYPDSQYASPADAANNAWSALLDNPLIQSS